MSITKVIKTSIDSNTIFRIQQDAAQNVHTIGITNLYYTDSSFANTANTTISSNVDSHIKIFGFGFKPNANVLLMPSQNTHLYSPNMVSFFENSIEANSYYVNWAEYRLKIQGHSANTFPVATEYDVFLINNDGTNTLFKKSLKFSPPNVYYGWISGGKKVLNPATDVSSIYRLDFENDTTYVKNNNMLEDKSSVYSVSNDLYGWILGGQIGAPIPSKTSTVERLNLFNDVSSLVQRNNLPGGAEAEGTTSKSNTHGYIIGGNVPTNSRSNSIDRLDFNNDTIYLTDRGILDLARSNTASVKNFTHSWIAMGTSGPALLSNISRFEFLSDTTQSLTRINGTARTGLSSTYDQTYGWFAAGSTINGAYGTVNVQSLVERITFSSDTSALSARGSLTLARVHLSSTGNYTYGWYMTGNNGTSMVSTVDRITYSNDTVTATSRSDYSDGSIMLTSAMTNHS